MPSSRITPISSNLPLFKSQGIQQMNEKIEDLVGQLTNNYDPYELAERGPMDAFS